MYFNAASAISPQQSFRQSALLQEPRKSEGSQFSCVEPDYSQLIDPKLIRRMSRVIRMGVATAMDALQQADLQQPSAILTGTAYGCLEDTGIFLQRMVENREEMLTPTAFIQSTHNTVGAQVALLLKCHAYNNTYVQRGHSFEAAVLDAMLLLAEKPGSKILLGAADETTKYSQAILERFGLFRHIASGEGACYFVVEAAKSSRSFARLSAMEILLQPNEAAFDLAVNRLLQRAGLQPAEISLLLTGNTGLPAQQEYYRKLENGIFPEAPVLPFKPLCGEYPTATAFAGWLAVNALQAGTVPAALLPGFGGPLRHILVYNIDPAGYHSLMLYSAC